MPVRVYGTKVISKRLQAVKKEIRSPELMQRIGRASVKHIQDRTRAGLDKDENPLKPLSATTIENRGRLSAFNRTSPHYQLSKSNLHFTGQLLRALKFTVNSYRVMLDFSGFHKGYKQGAKSRRSSGKGSVEHRDIIKWQAEKGRDIFGVDETLRQKIREMVVRQIRKAVRRVRK